MSPSQTNGDHDDECSIIKKDERDRRQNNEALMSYRHLYSYAANFERRSCLIFHKEA